MKKNLLHILSAFVMLFFVELSFAQVPSLGTAASFVLYTTDGAVKNENVLSLLTGNVGTNNGSNTGFGNVDGVMHTADDVTLQCKTDLLVANVQLNNAVVTVSPNHAPSFGAPGVGETLPAGVYSIPAATNLTGVLNLSGNASSVFIFKIGGSFSTATNSEINLIGGVSPCNVFWQVNGVVSLATGTKMKGTIITTNFAINMVGVTLEGRALSIIGAITVDGVVAKTPIGCGSPNATTTLTGPTAPTLGSTECYVLFSSSGDITNSNAAATFTGDMGTNIGTTGGFISANVTGNIHLLPDVSTGTCKDDLLPVYNYLNGLPYDIELLYPVQLGNNLVLTPHTYIMNSPAALTGNLYLNAQNNTNAVFVIQINGALTTATGAQVILLNGAQARNVYWKISAGLVDIQTNTVFIGTIVANVGAIGLKSGATLTGRALTIAGAVTTAGNSAVISGSCSGTGINSPKTAEFASIYPNPMTSSIIVNIDNVSEDNSSQLSIYNSTGKVMISKTITNTTTTIDTNFPSGIYFYKLISTNKSVQVGKLISK